MQEQAQEEKTFPPAKQISAIVIANPTSGSYMQNKRQIDETISYLQSHNWQAELKLTEAAGDARRLTREAVEQNVDVVVAVGGDGTINEVIQELAGSETALGVLPSGTINVWARETGIPLENEGAREVLVNGQVRRIDLGCFNNEHYFLLMAGIGLSGEITQTVEKHPAKRFGVLAYLFIGTRLGIGYPNFTAIMRMSKRTLRMRVLEIIVGNTQLYGGAIKFTWQARCDDGLLDVCIVRRQNVLGRIRVVLDFLLRRPERRRRIFYEKCDSISLHTSRPIAVQVDGDPAGETARNGFPPTTITIKPDALKVIVPQVLPEGLFSKAIN